MKNWRNFRAKSPEWLWEASAETWLFPLSLQNLLDGKTGTSRRGRLVDKLGWGHKFAGGSRKSLKFKWVIRTSAANAKRKRQSFCLGFDNFLIQFCISFRKCPTKLSRKRHKHFEARKSFNKFFKLINTACQKFILRSLFMRQFNFWHLLQFNSTLWIFAKACNSTNLLHHHVRSEVYRGSLGEKQLSTSHKSCTQWHVGCRSIRSKIAWEWVR